MYAHIAEYYRIRYNAIWSYANYLAIKPEYGGSGRKDWRERLTELWCEIEECEKSINRYA